MIKNLFNSRSLFAITHDVVVSVIAWFAAFLLRFNFEVPPEHLALMKQTFFVVLPLQMIVFLAIGLYRGTWRFASVPDLKRIFLAVIISAVVLVALLFIISSSSSVPRSVLILNPILLMLMMW